MKLPVVLVDSSIDGVDLDCVRTDNAASAYAGAKALVESGCRVTVVDSLVSGQRSNLASVAHSIQFIEASVIDFLKAGRPALSDFGFVFHAAQDGAGL